MGAISLRCLALDLPGDRGAGVYNSLVYPQGAFLTSSGTDGSNGVGGRVINMASPPAGSGILAASGTATAFANTAAFQSAYNFIKNAYLNFGTGSSYIIYIPDGTYQVNGSLIYTGSPAILMSGTKEIADDFNNIRLVGESRTGTVLQLVNNCAGFQTRTSPTAVIYYQNPATTFNNLATQNLCENLTVNTGSGNPGAVGIQFQGANGARMSNVSIISADGNALYGLWVPIGSLQAYLKDITVAGFQIGVYSYDNAENEASFEHITLQNQKAAALSIVGGGVSVRDMLSTQSGTVPAVDLVGPGGSCVLLDSAFTATSGTGPAVVLSSTSYQSFFARNTTVSGYPVAVQQSGTAVLSGSFISEYCSSPVTTLFTPQDTHSFALPVEDTPIIPWSGASSWINVESYRKSGTNTNSDTVAVQNAFAAAAASGSSNLVVYFPNLSYGLGSTVTVPANVSRVDFMFSQQSGNLSVGASSTNPVIFVGKGGYSTITINQPRTVIGEFISGSINNAQSSPIDTFLESCGNMGAGTQFATRNQEIWARCVDDEEAPVSNGDFVTNGGSLWIFGYKSENKDVSSIVVTGSGVAEVLGGYVNCTGSLDWPIAMVSNSNSSLCYTGFTNMLYYFPNAVQEVSGTLIATASNTQFPTRFQRYPYQYNFFIPMYVGGPPPTGPFGIFQGSQDIGQVAASGATINYNNATYFVEGSGSDIWNNADAFQFASTTWSGNGTLTALVNSVDNTSIWAKGGVMFRSSTNANAMFVDLLATPSEGIAMQARTTVGGAASNVGFTSTSFAPPYWVQLQRTGTSSIVGSISTDGTSWTQLGAATVNLPATAYAGLCVTAHTNNSNGTLCRSIMSNVSLLPASPAGVAATSGSGQIGLTWSPSSGATSYNVYRATSGTGAYTLIASSTSAAYTDTNVTDTTAYWYVVTALDASGETLDSNQATTTVILPPLQQWRLLNFGTLNPADPVGGDTADPAGCGVPNLMRYALGLTLGGTATDGLPVVSQTGGYLTLTFTRLRADTDITYQVEACNDLESWSKIWTSGTVPYGGGANPQQQVTVQDSAPISTAPGAKRFFHLKVTVP